MTVKEVSPQVKAAVAVALAFASLLPGTPSPPVVPVPKSAKKAQAFRVRFLVIRHSPDGIAHSDAAGAEKAVQEAKKAGLNVTNLGTVDSTSGLAALKKATARAVKEASPKDTLMIHTIGHGYPNGTLQNLGARTAVLKALTDVTEGKCRLLWWQLSCHATAGLPKDVKKHVAVLCSSPATHISGVGIQHRLIRKVLLGLATKSKELDADSDGTVTAKELKGFLNKQDHLRRGDLLIGECSPFCPCE